VLNVESLTIDYALAWDSYVYGHPSATLYHLSVWKDIIEKSYGHEAYYLMAVEDDLHQAPENPQPAICQQNLTTCTPKKIVGILPLVHLKHFIFGNSLVSIPFFDLGGVLANDGEIEKILLSAAIRLGRKLKADTIELRQVEPLSWLTPDNFEQLRDDLELTDGCAFQVRSHKARMLLKLPESSQLMRESFKSKLRSQIQKPIKEGLIAKLGQIEQLEHFYHVFAINMRDIGSPVHSKRLMLNVMSTLPEKSKVVVVYKGNQPLACSLIIDFQGILENPWASALRKYSHLSPNMLLYWTMLEYACDNKFTCFDFGRSSPEEGTYKFKEQWGAQPSMLYWYYLSLNCQRTDYQGSEKDRFGQLIALWKKIPIPIATAVGPSIRKYIGL
jgi:serine/alanine adding enzyme